MRVLRGVMAEIPATRPSLLVRLRDARDEAAWRQFVDLYAPLVYGYARKQGLQDADAHRALQFIGNLAVDRPRIVASQFDKHCVTIAYYLSSKLV